VFILEADQADAQSFVTRESRLTPHTLVVYKARPCRLHLLHSLLHALSNSHDSASGAVIMTDVCIVCLGDFRLSPEQVDAETDNSPIKTEPETIAPLPVLPSEQRYSDPVHSEHSDPPGASSSDPSIP
jgi:hypothetical protein